MSARNDAWYGYSWIRRNRRRAIYARDGYRCVYCGAPEPLSLDHVRPVARGGTNDSSNLVTACSPCNSARKDLRISAWVAALAERGHDPIAIVRRLRYARTKRATVLVAALARRIRVERIR